LSLASTLATLDELARRFVEEANAWDGHVEEDHAEASPVSDPVNQHKKKSTRKTRWALPLEAAGRRGARAKKCTICKGEGHTGVDCPLSPWVRK
jgi:hypothetical protein